jgi:hypothetical protein
MGRILIPIHGNDNLEPVFQIISLDSIHSDPQPDIDELGFTPTPDPIQGHAKPQLPTIGDFP